MWAARTGTIMTACAISSSKLPFPGVSKQISHHLSIQGGAGTDHRKGKWILLSVHEEQGLRRVLRSSLPTATFEGQSDPRGWPVCHLLGGPGTVQVWRNPGTSLAQWSFSCTWASLPLYLLLCSSQTCCFLSRPSSCVLLSHHFSGWTLMAFFLLVLFSEYYCDQTSTEIPDPGHLCLQPAVCQYCSELSLPLQRLSQTETYQGCIRMQATSTKFSGFHIKCCCGKCC